MLHLIISSDLSKSKLDFFPMESLTHPCLLPGAHRSSSHQSHPCSLRVRHTRSSAGYTCHRRIGTGADGRRSEENDLQPQQQAWRKTQESASHGNAESKTRFATSSTASTGLTTSSQFFFLTSDCECWRRFSDLVPFTFYRHARDGVGPSCQNTSSFKQAAGRPHPQAAICCSYANARPCA